MFTQLHLHTQYSLLDGACRIDKLMERLKALGQTACAITDHGAMYGAVDFYLEAKKHGIHPVIGCEIYVCEDMDDKSSAARDYNHLILLCENNTGYHNLIKLVSEGYTRGFYYKPRVDYRLLEQYHEGLIAMSACLSGAVPQLLLDGRDGDARRMAERHLQIFGRGNYYIELMDHSLAEEKQVLSPLIKLARSLDIPLCATNDCHYLEKGDADAQEILMCIQTGKTLSDASRMRMNTNELYVKSEQEMRKLFPGLDDAIENTNLIAQRCRVEFDFKSRHLPRYPLPEGQTAVELLRRECWNGLWRLYGPEREDAKERLKYELGVIESMGFVDYFLIVWDFIKYARDNGILVGPGRGSGAGSIAAYSLGITGIDPLNYNLLFERFLNPERISMPDFDIDFDYERRGEVIDYVARKYGEDHVAQIITFGTMAARAVIRDVGRVMDMSYQEVDQVAKLVPMQLNITLGNALELSKDFRELYENDPKVTRLIDTALKLEGMPRHASTHAAGVLITGKPVSDYVPLQTNDEVITTQYPMGTLEALGLLKMDFLGLRTLTVIGDSLKMIKALGGPEMTPEQIPMDDEGVYKMISSGDTDGVFQLESGGMTQFLTNMKPENFEDIIAAISLYRPGPMESIPRYIRGKRDPKSVEYLHPKLAPILDVTYGCLVYQEQVMQMVRDLAGYSMGRSDLVRRAMSKKKHDVMAKEKEYFIRGKLRDDGTVEVPGAVRNGVPEAVAERLFDEMTAFASYAFNKSHAAAYAVVAAQTGWLKLHYPVQFMAALMNSITGNTDKVAYYIQYCKKHGVKVLPPDINKSRDKFSVEREGDEIAIRFGLGAIKNVGHGAVRELRAEIARGGPYRNLFDFVQRAPMGAVNKKALECLIKAGAFDSLPHNRPQLLMVYERAVDSSQKARKSQVDGQISLFGLGDEQQVEVPPIDMPSARDISALEKLQMEKQMTGVYISGHPLDDYREMLLGMDMDSRVLSELHESEQEELLKLDGRHVRMGGIITERRTKATRSGNMMAFLTLEDLYGTTEVLVFPRVHEKYGEQTMPDSVVVLTGKLSVSDEDAPKLLMDKAVKLTGGEPGYAVQIMQPEKQPEQPSDMPPELNNTPSSDGHRGTERRKLFIRIPGLLSREDVALIIMKTPGHIPVKFYLNDERRYIDAPRNLYVGEQCDLAALEALLGGENVVLKGGALG